ncbi:class II aldolase/adducin family protein [Paenibacillus doosanensis]|uniref:L-fuculose phosphate aldolase n=1 Tax=Paenibacillus konkukensis TaxID=2020716 RepID=A0ABY4RN37_9BACL|nr:MULTISPECIES: class II aldolase/adducin family protein [Paenibacillus]MCS7461733.1 class II aldolase/adducin family protein [Paenibacillus doosanensis]UQZ83573.1 L-fuculose phosphate aldolase [Paenibacillus konkukensis]
MPDLESVKQELRKTGKYMMEYGLAWGNAGNISARTTDDRYVITASGTFLGELEASDLVECSLSGEVLESDGKKPSKETPMHRAIYDNRPEIGAVLHASPFYSTLVACSSVDIPSNWFVETMYYLERVARVPYCHPGSTSLGDAVAAKAKEANILLLENHGVLVYDVSIREARMALQTLEMACQMLVTSQTANIKMNGLSREVERDFVENAGYKPRRNWNV